MLEITIDTNEAALDGSVMHAIESLNQNAKENIKLNVVPLVCDLQIGKYLIEHKKTTDLLTREEDGVFHIFKQLAEHRELCKQGYESILLIEGLYSAAAWRHDRKSKLNTGARIDGLLASVVIDYPTKIVKLDHHDEAVSWLRYFVTRMLATPADKPMALRSSRRGLSLDEYQEYILQGFPGIGAVKSQAILLEHRGAFSNIFTWLSCGGGAKTTGKKTHERISRILKHEYGTEDTVDDSA